MHFKVLMGVAFWKNKIFDPKKWQNDNFEGFFLNICPYFSNSMQIKSVSELFEDKNSQFSALTRNLFAIREMPGSHLHFFAHFSTKIDLKTFLGDSKRVRPPWKCHKLCKMRPNQSFWLSRDTCQAYIISIIKFLFFSFTSYTKKKLFCFSEETKNEKKFFFF